MNDVEWSKFMESRKDFLDEKNQGTYRLEVIRQEGDEVVEDIFENVVNAKLGDQKTSRTILKVETSDGEAIFYNFEGVHRIKLSVNK